MACKQVLDWRERLWQRLYLLVRELAEDCVFSSRCYCAGFVGLWLVA